MRKCFQLLWLLTAALLVGGCFEATEECWLHADGSGRVRVDMAVARPALALAGGEEAIRRRIVTALEADDRIRLEHLSAAREGDRDRLIVEVAFDSAKAWSNLAAPGTALPRQARALAGSFDITTRFRTLDFRRTIFPGDALGLGPFGPRVDPERNDRLVHIIHLPLPATRSNATGTRDGGRTLVWDHALAEHLDWPFALEFEAPMPLPRKWVVTAIAAILAGIAGLAWWWRRRRLGAGG